MTMALSQEVMNAVIVSAIFGATFAVAELMRLRFAAPVEVTRKFVHLVGGLVSLSFAYVFTSHWTLLVLCIIFVGLLHLTRTYGWLASVHKVERVSSGALYHPMAIYGTFCAAGLLGRPEFYLISTMVLSVSDTIAALIGSAYGFKLYKVQEERKSFEGSVMFFVSTFLIVHLGLLLLTPIGRIESVLCGVLIAVCVTLFEAISLGGTDNLFIPWGTMLILSKVNDMPWPRLLNQFWVMAIACGLVLLAVRPSRKLSASGMAGMALMGYATFGMLGFEWFLPVIISALLISFTDLFVGRAEDEEELARIRQVFYGIAVSLVWMLISGFAHSYRHLLILPYLVGFLAPLSIFWKWRRRELLARRELEALTELQRLPLVSRGMFLTLVFVPMHLILNFEIKPVFFVLAVLVGVVLSDRLYFSLINRIGRKWNRDQHQRAVVGIVLVVTALLLAVSWPVYVSR